MTDHLARLDPRAKRTRTLLRDALIELIMECGDYSAITITDITNRADVSRSTFYLHFRDVDQLLFDTMRDVYMDIVESHYVTSNPLSKAGVADYEHVAKFAPFYRVMLGEKGSPAFRVRVEQFLVEETMKHVKRRFSIMPQHLRLPLEIVVTYITAGDVGLISWWIENDMPYTPEEMSQMSWQLCTNGLAWALGVDVEMLDQ